MNFKKSFFLLFSILGMTFLSFTNVETPKTLNINSTNDCTSYSSWGNYGREAKLYIRICRYEGGSNSGGYFQLKNGNSKDVRVTCKVNFKNGTSYEGSFKIEAYSDDVKPMCYKCVDVGVESWELSKISFEGEQGFW